MIFSSYLESFKDCVLKSTKFNESNTGDVSSRCMKCEEVRTPPYCKATRSPNDTTFKFDREPDDTVIYECINDDSSRNCFNSRSVLVTFKPDCSKSNESPINRVDQVNRRPTDQQCIESNVSN